MTCNIPMYFLFQVRASDPCKCYAPNLASCLNFRNKCNTSVAVFYCSCSYVTNMALSKLKGNEFQMHSSAKYTTFVGIPQLHTHFGAALLTSGI